MRATMEVRYPCPTCELPHETAGEAASCCPIESVRVWVCNECGDDFDYNDKDDAEECCR